MSRLTRDGTAEPVSRDQILRHGRGQGNIIFSVQLTTSRIGNLTRLIHTLLYVMTIHTYIHTYMYTYIVLSRVPSTPACYRGTLGFKEKSECICCGHASGIFSPRPLWFGGCATHATPCSVPGYSYFRMCLEKSEHKLLVQCSNPREFFFIRVFKGVLSSEFVDYEQKKTNDNQQKTRLSARNLLRTLLQP